MHSFTMASRFVFLFYFVGLAFSLPIPREVPQEHSHNLQVASVRSSLNLDNPSNFGDPIFPLLGNAVASQGLGDTTDPDCLQQAVADQAFTNAKAANDIDGQVNALIYRALERNTGKVGLASAPCTSTQAINPEIAAIQQHQDPASTNATAINKAIVLELAKQIASVGGDPQDALKSGTFAPGDVNDPTAAGNTCDDANDEQGCIFTQNLLVPDATPEEIQAAVADGSDVTNNNGGSGSNSTVNSSGADATGNSDPTMSDNDNSMSNSTGDDASDAQDDSGASTTDTNSMSGQNLQSFTGNLGGIAPPPVTPGGRGFVVEGNDDFTNVGAALGRSCDVQHNQCADLANSADGRSLGLKTSQCDEQNQSCKAANTSANSASGSTGNGKAVGNSGVPGNGKGKVNNGSMGNGKANGNGNGVGGDNGNTDAPQSSASDSTGAAQSDTSSSASDSTSTQNLQTFTGALGGISPPTVTAGGRGFIVQDSDEFTNISAALGRSCDIQHNKCANLANSATGRNSGLTVGQCDQQDTTCRAAAT
ncbi:hypothetical protein AGABI2DRAFT_186603 [Agaricus bisporus var. bisporus H97]|uniref:hypothetical protein n=1 Tax=Agaricus bisporus var. bisporus (strain H97 / ATCC MYA-4626 / FGSC 10389) TaxID=936046 RepID=UPI00029F52CC|nr:hypothetical protein AGABI2DRAFT_186603 [Agaricus bisporus var. bisporus H97]EKV45905.1 hypothetical protein AGABI2DRAFT_186603 [Agaricus bisporus var. bisporus H97]